MSRRESRSSLGARQNDALFEFESFKKKFLLANKHITKLNSTLSVRIEELNAQISTLYVENLRLRASEIALASQLKREREQSRKVLADAEAASHNLTKQLTHLRTSLRHQRSSSSDGGSPTLSPLAKRSVVSLIPSDGSGSPQLNKISRPPNVPGIYEDDEPVSSDNEVEEIVEVSPPRKKSQRSKEKEKTRERASRLPVLTASLEPHAHPTPTHVDLLSIASSSTSASKPRRTIRRQSGLLTVNTAATEALSVPRSGSPAFGSPIRLEAGLAEEEEERAVVSGRAALVDKEGDDEIVLEVKKEKKKGKSKDVRDSEKESEGAEVPRPKEKKRKEKERDKEKDFDEQGVESVLTKTKSAAKDHRSALQPIDSNVDDHTHSDRENKPPAASPAPARQFLRPVSPSGGGSSRGSSSPVPAPPAGSSLGDETAVGGRERRQRKSVNYAEPKLNTKMRKPDPLPGSEPPVRKKRSSAAAVMVQSSTHSSKPTSSSSTATSSTAVEDSADPDREPEDREEEREYAPSSRQTPLHHPSSSSSSQFPLRTGYTHSPSLLPPEHYPLPASRPGSAANMYSPVHSTTTRVSGSTSSSSSAAMTPAPSCLKRKKARQLDEESEDDNPSGSDGGAEADGEWIASSSSRPGSSLSRGAASSSSSGVTGTAVAWANVNIEGRRKGLPKRSAAVAAVVALEDIRRHSMAI